MPCGSERGVQGGISSGFGEGNCVPEAPSLGWKVTGCSFLGMCAGTSLEPSGSSGLPILVSLCVPCVSHRPHPHPVPVPQCSHRNPELTPPLLGRPGGLPCWQLALSSGFSVASPLCQSQLKFSSSGGTGEDGRATAEQKTVPGFI